LAGSSEEANFIDVDSVGGDGIARTRYGAFPFAGDQTATEGASSLLIRPEDIRFVAATAAPAGNPSIPVEVSRTVFSEGRRMVAVTTSSGDEFTVECGKAEVPSQGADVAITWDPSAAILLNK
jgi:ABC-type Fe3+/spermidine/putrescine transport system ATPase subunit